MEAMFQTARLMARAGGGLLEGLQFLASMAETKDSESLAALCATLQREGIHPLSLTSGLPEDAARRSFLGRRIAGATGRGLSGAWADVLGLVGVPEGPDPVDLHIPGDLR
jgi:hypothetical protein